MGCAVPDTSGIQDRHAERMVLCAILHLGRGFLVKLNEIGFEKADFYHDVNQASFDQFCYVANGFPAPILVEVYEDFRDNFRLYKWAFGSRRDFIEYLVEVWSVFTTWHLECQPIRSDGPPVFQIPHDVAMWLDEDIELTLEGLAAAASAYAQKVIWLSRRRQTIHNAMEAIRDAENPIGDADYMKLRGDDIALEDWG